MYYANVVKHNGNSTFINDMDGAINKITIHSHNNHRY